MDKDNKNLFVDDYGELLAQVNGYDLVSFETDNGYQGQYCAVLTDGERLFYYIDNYGSCSGCDWLEDVNNNGIINESGKSYIVDYKQALEYCGDLKPRYSVPKDKPLEVVNLGEYKGFLIK